MPKGIYLRTKEHGKNISKAQKALGELHWRKRPEVRLQHSLIMKGRYLGRKLSDEIKKKISEANKNNKTGIENGKNTRFKKGFKHTEEWREMVSKKQRGENHYNWQGGKTPMHETIRRSLEMRIWKKSVFERDNYTCRWCKIRSGNGKAVVLHADHIKPFAFYPELRFELSNGQTLCTGCHLWKTAMDIKLFRGKVPELNIY